MRWLLILILVQGLAPDLAEVAEVAVHVAFDGYVPHTAADPNRDERGGEHGCGTTLHHCTCCPSQALGAGRELTRVSRQDLPHEPHPAVRTLESVGEPTRLFRPPIA
ncbi:MAG: hypothetical protein U0229_13250 [Anaeromyxobacter sp.]